MALVVALLLIQNHELEKKVARLLPNTGEERWLAVGWEPNLVKARAEANRLGKPVLLWIMDGNVLGCT